MKEIVDRLQENRQIALAKSILETHGYKVENLKESGEQDIQRTIFGISKNSDYTISEDPREYVRYFNKIKDIVDINDVIVVPNKLFGSQRTGYVTIAAPISVSKEEALERLESIYNEEAEVNTLRWGNVEYRFDHATVILTKFPPDWLSKAVWDDEEDKDPIDSNQLYVELRNVRGVRDKHSSSAGDYESEIEGIISALKSIGWDMKEQLDTHVGTLVDDNHSNTYVGTLVDDNSKSSSRKTISIIKNLGFIRSDSYHSNSNRSAIYKKENIGAQLEYSRTGNSLRVEISFKD